MNALGTVWGMYWFSSAAVADYLTETTQVFFLTVLEAETLLSRCRQGGFSEGREEGSVPGLSPWPEHGHLLPELSYHPPCISRFPLLRVTHTH